MTDIGVNVTTQLTDKLRVGVQLYDRNIGQLGGWYPLLDYAYLDYRFKDWLGVRAGRVKTQLGLYTSTQDADFLRTWALLPQSVYPTDLRSETIAHDGVDLYGAIPIGHAGTVNYTTYAGVRPTDKRSGQYFQYEDSGLTNNVISASMAGADVRWNTPVTGLFVGVSEVFQKEHISQDEGTGQITGVGGPYHTTAAYIDYAIGKLHFAAEGRRNIRFEDLRGLLPFRYDRDLDETAFFVSAAYRVSKWLEVGAYNSRYYLDSPLSMTGAPPPSSVNHIFDQVATLRFDLTRFWNFKLEGHFMDGTGDPYSPHGFYTRVNPSGTLKPTTNMLVARMGWDF